MLLVMIALFGWFGYAVGEAIDDDGGGFWGMLIGIATGIALIFFV